MKRPYPFDQPARGVLALLYIWFGALKIVGVSSVATLVALLSTTMVDVNPTTVIISLGIAEVLIGLSFLSAKLTNVSLVLFALHMVACALPLVMLPDVTWVAPFVPTMEGQYIIKNIALIALAVVIAKTKTK